MELRVRAGRQRQVVGLRVSWLTGEWLRASRSDCLSLRSFISKMALPVTMVHHLPIYHLTIVLESEVPKDRRSLRFIQHGFRNTGPEG